MHTEVDGEQHQDEGMKSNPVPEAHIALHTCGRVSIRLNGKAALCVTSAFRGVGPRIRLVRRRAQETHKHKECDNDADGEKQEKRVTQVCEAFRSGGCLQARIRYSV
jgi:hypothetical protein